MVKNKPIKTINNNRVLIFISKNEELKKSKLTPNNLINRELIMYTKITLRIAPG